MCTELNCMQSDLIVALPTGTNILPDFPGCSGHPSHRAEQRRVCMRGCIVCVCTCVRVPSLHWLEPGSLGPVLSVYLSIAV